jgi:hypothetical protein
MVEWHELLLLDITLVIEKELLETFTASLVKVHFVSQHSNLNILLIIALLTDLITGNLFE